jgi:hypothetical protein
MHLLFCVTFAQTIVCRVSSKMHQPIAANFLCDAVLASAVYYSRRQVFYFFWKALLSILLCSQLMTIASICQYNKLCKRRYSQCNRNSACTRKNHILF